jgi:hypothetical protein
MRQVIRRQHKALPTEDNSVHGLRHNLAAILERTHTLSSEQKLERFLTELALKRDLAASTQNQAFNAIALFYKDVRGNLVHDVEALRTARLVHLRHAPTISEIRSLLQTVSDLAG